MSGQKAWQRVVLLIVLAYEGLGGLVGGGLLIAKPDGQYMSMPVEIMHGIFPDFVIPGVILLGLGLLTLSAFFSVLRQRRNAWVVTSLAIGGFIVWFFVEIVILRELHWLHLMWGTPVILGAIVTVPLLPFGRLGASQHWGFRGLGNRPGEPIAHARQH
ncbi:MAG: hypothetical protein ACKVPX_08300 [Myxococcaceae bacterium]